MERNIMKPIYLTSTVVTRHLIDTKCHNLLRDALADAKARIDPVGRVSDWVIVRCADAGTWNASDNSATIVTASSLEAEDFAHDVLKAVIA